MSKKDTRRDAWNFDYVGFKSKKKKVKPHWEIMSDDSFNKTLKLVIIILYSFAIISVANELMAGTWNDKPVMCAKEKEMMYTIQDKNEKLLFNAVQLAKVRSKEGLQEKPVMIPLQIYANIKTKTYTIVEFHPQHSIYCVVSYGTNLDFISPKQGDEL